MTHVFSLLGDFIWCYRFRTRRSSISRVKKKSKKKENCVKTTQEGQFGELYFILRRGSWMTVSCRCESDNWNQHQRARMWTCVKFWTRKSQKPGDLQLSFSGIIAKVSAGTEKDRLCCSLDVSTLTSSVLFQVRPWPKDGGAETRIPKSTHLIAPHRIRSPPKWRGRKLGRTSSWGAGRKKPASLVNSRNSHVQLRYPRWSHA